MAKVLPEVEAVICYQQGFDPLHAIPLFLRKPEDVEKVTWSPLCAQNLASYLPQLKKKKMAVVVKGCDSRAIVQFMQENLILRENVIVIGIPCEGVVDVAKIQELTGQKAIKDVTFDGKGNVTVKTDGGEKTFSMAEVSARKCKTCQYPTPVVYDHLIGDPIKSDKPAESVYDDVAEIEAMSLSERLEYWKKEFSRCIRCYACRNACPMCVCQESCIVESRNPHWMSQKSSTDEKVMFHLIHALHLAGRCIECGECERACPMNIPVPKLKKKINKEMKQLFNYEPGVKVDEKPPMYIFDVDEVTIKEHKLT